MFVMFPSILFNFFHVDLYNGNYTNFFNSTEKIVLSRNAGTLDVNFGTWKNKLVYERGNAEREAKSEERWTRRLYRKARHPWFLSQEYVISSSRL